MKYFDCDLHFHGPYSGGVSKNMSIPLVSEQAKLKGLHILGSADILHKEWLKHCKQNLEESRGVYREEKNGTAFILSTEVQCSANVHHCIYFPSFAEVEQVKEKLQPYSKDMDKYGGGRPRIALDAEKIASVCLENNCLIGPAHAFTPYYGLYGHYSSLADCYKSASREISFLELGLSADTDMADLIEELHSVSFLSNSDSHSPWPHRIGREFTRFKMKEPSFKDFRKGLERDGERKITLNVGLNPKEGMYHCTACNTCHSKYSMADAVGLQWRCPNCKGTIKKGVKDRIREVAALTEPVHPDFRPNYVQILPLAEIIAFALDLKGVQSKRVQSLWLDLVEEFHSEIDILLEEPLENIARIDARVAKHVEAFRKGLVLYVPGGGGHYGKPIICLSERECEEKTLSLGKELECGTDFKEQKRLTEF